MEDEIQLEDVVEAPETPEVPAGPDLSAYATTEAVNARFDRLEQLLNGFSQSREPAPAPKEEDPYLSPYFDDEQRAELANMLRTTEDRTTKSVVAALQRVLEPMLNSVTEIQAERTRGNMFGNIHPDAVKRAVGGMKPEVLMDVAQNHPEIREALIERARIFEKDMKPTEAVRTQRGYAVSEAEGASDEESLKQARALAQVFGTDNVKRLKVRN